MDSWQLKPREWLFHSLGFNETESSIQHKAGCLLGQLGAGLRAFSRGFNSMKGQAERLWEGVTRDTHASISVREGQRTAKRTSETKTPLPCQVCGKLQNHHAEEKPRNVAVSEWGTAQGLHPQGLGSWHKLPGEAGLV